MEQTEIVSIDCCEGCKVHHMPELGLEKTLGKCTCPCHTNPAWSLTRVKLTVELRCKKQ